MKTRFRITLILFLICLLALPGLAGAAAADDRSAPLTAPLFWPTRPSSLAVA